jgi:hypothetical protein
MKEKLLLVVMIVLSVWAAANAIPAIGNVNSASISRAVAAPKIGTGAPAAGSAPVAARLSTSLFLGSRGKVNILKPASGSGAGNADVSGLESRIDGVDGRIDGLDVRLSELEDATPADADDVYTKDEVYTKDDVYTKDETKELLDEKQDLLPDGATGHVLSKTADGVRWIAPQTQTLPACPDDGSDYVLVAKASGGIECEKVVY